MYLPEPNKPFVWESACCFRSYCGVTIRRIERAGRGGLGCAGRIHLRGRVVRTGCVFGCIDRRVSVRRRRGEVFFDTRARGTGFPRLRGVPWRGFGKRSECGLIWSLSCWIGLRWRVGRPRVMDKKQCTASYHGTLFWREERTIFYQDFFRRSGLGGVSGNHLTRTPHCNTCYTQITSLGSVVC